MAALGTIKVESCIGTIRAGDTVLIALSKYGTQQSLVELADALDDAFPGITFVIIEGVSGLAVQQKEATP